MNEAAQQVTDALGVLLHEGRAYVSVSGPTDNGCRGCAFVHHPNGCPVLIKCIAIHGTGALTHNQFKLVE